MTYEKTFSAVKKAFSKADKKALSSDFAFQFNITGEGEGIFYAACKNGTLSIEPYDYKDRDVIFTADAKTLVAVAEGKLEPVNAMNDGKLIIDGDNEQAKKIMLLVAKATKKPATKKATPKTVSDKAPAKKASTKPAAKPAAKTEAKTAAKAEAKPAAKTTAKK